MKIKVKKLNEDAKLPVYSSKQAIGADLFSTEERLLEPGKIVAIGTGISLEPEGFCDMQVRPRSGLALKNGITVLNSPGTIDPDYRGEVKVILINHSNQSFLVEKGMKIAQLVALSTELFSGRFSNPAQFVETLELSDTQRGSGGFGSTGLK